MRLLLYLFLALGACQDLRNNSKHRRHHSKPKEQKEIEFVQVSADLSDQRIMLEGIIEQVNQLALLVQRQNYFDDTLKNRPFELVRQLDALDWRKSSEETKIVESLKQQLHIITQAMNKEDSVIQCADEDVCKICRAQVYYILDEDNWYMIGYEHGFKKEFQFLLDSAKSALGHSAEIYLTFSSDNDICLQFNDMKHPVDINSVLQLYLQTTIDDYQNSIVRLPTQGVPSEFHIRASYSGKQFVYRDLRFAVFDQQPKEILGGRTNKVLFTIENQDVMISQEGQFFIGSGAYPYKYHTSRGRNRVESISVKYSEQLAGHYVSSRFFKDAKRFQSLTASVSDTESELLFEIELD